MEKKTTTFNQLQYIADYNKANIVYRKLSLNKTVPEDMVLLSWLDSRPEGTSGYLKHLIRKDMEGETK